MASQDKVWVAIHDRVALIRVEGRGSFKSSTALKEFGRSAIGAGCTRAVLDMGACVGMDSTFMGTLAGLATRLRQHENGGMVLYNLSPRVRALVSTLGLDRLVEAYEAGATPDSLYDLAQLSDRMRELQSAPESRDAITRTMIEAHEHLVSLTPENLPRFKDVLSYLREDLNRAQEPPSL
ncbi:MAG: STAS domain-containing protein [Kiritimatiellae bacterium]|nr:STAS domain-containing protein [Kiritimatiellia bacterium]MDW8457728.1 STAS domain-containing protein [Verrucomicrobiota bacterium]